MDAQPTAGRSRVAALDGLRGLTIILVLLTHSWIIYPKESIERIPVVRGLFHGGSVTMFFVIGGFIVTHNLLRERERGVLDPLRFYLRRLVRIGVQLVPLAAAILVLHRLDSTDTSTNAATNRSLLSILTYTWNTYLVDHALDARPDLGHLWYLSVQQQVYLVLPLAVLLLAGHRRLFAAVLVVTTVAVVVHRYSVLHDGDVWAAPLLTTTRADGLVLGALVAVLLPRLTMLARADRWLTPLCLAVLGGLTLMAPEVPDDQYLREWGLVFTLVSTVLVATLVQGMATSAGASGAVTQGTSAAHRLLGHPALQWLGTASLAIYVWHYPLFWAVSRHTEGWSSAARVMVTLALLAVIVVAAQRFIEEPTRLWLRRSAWFRAPFPSPEPGHRHADRGIR
jgi:peptidoglycan/LPS O-acetylase OafA/YrhL